MPGQVNPQRAQILQYRQMGQDRMNRAMQELSTGERLLRPGDDVAAFSESANMDIDQATELAKMRADQERLTWFQMGVAYLGDIMENLSSMRDLSIRASSSGSAEGDIKVLDANFQRLKAQISSVVDGSGGQQAPSATLRGIPLFMGFSPDLEVGAEVSNAYSGFEDLNLFTGYGREGFSAMSLIGTSNLQAATAPTPVDVSLSGTADGGSTTTITLDLSASSMDDVYINRQITIIGGTGSGQTATIADYDGETRVATLDTTLATAPDNSSTYQIDDLKQNTALLGAPSFSSVSVASHVWGADNHLTERMWSNQGTFYSITETEKAYRTANSIDSSDLEAKTYEEKEARRKLNIFDPEYGNLLSSENAGRMNERIGHAIEKISIFMQRWDAKAGAIKSNYDASAQKADAQENGASLLSQADIAGTAAEYQELRVNSNIFTSLSERLYQNIGRLNALINNRGRR